MRGLLILGFIIAILCAGIALASTTVHSEVDCTGECSVKQTYNGDSVEVKSSGSTKITTQGDSSKAEVDIDTDGEVKVNVNDENNPKIVIVNNLSSSAPSNSSAFNWSCSSCSSKNNTLEPGENNSGDSGDFQVGENKSSENTQGQDNSSEAEANESKLEERTVEGMLQRFYLLFQNFTGRFWFL